MKIVLFFCVIILSSCSKEPEDKSSMPPQKGALSESKQSKTPIRTNPSSNVLKGYQENIKRAKDMEKEILEAAKKQRKAIDG